jgi:hypothetical protein
MEDPVKQHISLHLSGVFDNKTYLLLLINTPTAKHGALERRNISPSL